MIASITRIQSILHIIKHWEKGNFVLYTGLASRNPLEKW
jgi:hypothetical protein